MEKTPPRRGIKRQDSLVSPDPPPKEHTVAYLAPWQSPVPSPAPAGPLVDQGPSTSEAAESPAQQLSRLFAKPVSAPVQVSRAAPTATPPAARVAQVPLLALPPPAAPAHEQAPPTQLQAETRGVVDDAAMSGWSWSIDMNEQVPIPVVREQSPASAGANGSQTTDALPGWRCALKGRMPADSSPSALIWRRWVSKAEALATEHVYDAFARLQGRLRDMKEEAVSRTYCGNSLATVVALAGAEVADHEATMKQVKQLVRSELSDSSVALVGPQDFRSLAHVMECICGQLLPESLGGVGHNDQTSAAGKKRRLRVGLPDFLTWYHSQGTGASDAAGKGLAVLLVQQVDAIPKDALRDMLNCLGPACGGVPILVVLGLQHPPDGQSELLDGRLTKGLRVVEALNLFDARTVTSRLLEHLAEDGDCPLALSPALLACLRKEFNHTCHSVNHVLKMLGFICVEMLSGNPFADLCMPLDDPKDWNNNSDLESILAKRLRSSPGALERQQALLGAKAPAEGSQEGISLQAARAAAQACIWRKRLCQSLPLWDELLCAVQPIARYQARTYRLDRLLSQLWPHRDGDVDVQRKNVAKLLDSCLEQLPLLKPSALDQLLEVLAEVSTGLDEDLHDAMQTLQTEVPNLAGAALRHRVGEWLKAVMAQYWHPLGDDARHCFLTAFSFDTGVVGEIEAMSGRGSAPEALLLPLAHGRNLRDNTRLSDAALLYRFLESSSGRSAQICDLWKAFAQEYAQDGVSSGGAAGSTSEPKEMNEAEPAAVSAKDLQRRFGLGVFALYAMGLHTPKPHAYGIGRAEKKKRAPFDGWRLKKLLFGRPWLWEGREQRRRVEEDVRARILAAEAARCGEIEQQREQEKPVGEAEFYEAPKGLAQQILDNIAPWKRGTTEMLASLRRWTPPEPAAKRRKAGERRAPKIFMS